MSKYQIKRDIEHWFKTMQEEHNAKNPNYQVTDKQLSQFTKLILKTIDYNVEITKDGIYTMQFISDVNYMWKDFTDDIKFEKKVCPDCNGSGVYQEYDEYDRYYVHHCATCDGSGEIACQSVKSRNSER